MRNELCVAVGLGALCVMAAPAYSWDGTGYAWDEQTWELPKDALGAGNQISFNQRANGVWYFMESGVLAHSPVTYRFLPDYTSPCVGVGSFVTGVGVECWGDLTGRDQSPKVALNATASQNGEIPPYTLALAPSNTRFRSSDGSARSTGRSRSAAPMASWNPAQAAVVWSVDKGGAILKSGRAP